MSGIRQPGEQRPGHVPEPERSAIEEITTEAGRPTSRLGRAFGFGAQVGLDVPSARVPDDRARRERAIALTGLVAVVALVGLAVIGRDQMAAFGATPTPSVAVAAATAAPTPQPTRTRRPATPTPRPTPEPVRVPELANQVLDGAPLPIFVGRDGDDAVFHTWEAGQPRLDAALTIPGVYSGLEPHLEVLLPDGTGLLVAGEHQGRGVARVVGLDGSMRWEGALATTDFSGYTFGDDGGLLAIAIAEGEILLIPLGAEVADDDLVKVDLLRSPLRTGPAGPPRPWPTANLPDDTELVAFDAEHEWLYVRLHYSNRTFSLRVSVDDGIVEPLTSMIPAHIEARARAGLAPSEDPETGRRVAPGEGLHVVEADGEEAFVVDGLPIGAWGWLGNGSLAILAGAGEFGTDEGVTLHVVDEVGNVGAPVLEIDQPTYPSLLGARDGHVLLGFSSDGYGAQFEIAMVRVSDGAVASLAIVDPSDAENIRWWSSGWLDDLQVDAD